MIFDPVLGVYSDPGVHFYCLPVRSRKARASTGVYEFNGVVIGQYVYKCVYGLHSLTKA